MSKRYSINYPEPFEKMEGFTHLPDDACTGERRCGYAALKLFAVLCLFDQRDNKFPTSDELLSFCKISPASFIRSRKELVEKGWLTVTETKPERYQKETIPDA